MAATDDVVEKGEIEVWREESGLTDIDTFLLQETEKEQESDNKEGEEKKDDCGTCKNDQEVVFIQVRDSPSLSIVSADSSLQDLGFTVKVAAPGVEPFDIQVSSMELVQEIHQLLMDREDTCHR